MGGDHGHCHPHIVSAIQKQAGKLNQIIFAGHTHEPAEEVAALLLKVAPRGLEHVFFSDSGSTSVQVALKMALGYGTTSGRADVHRRDATFIPWRYDRGDVGWRPWCVQRGVQAPAIRRYVNPVPGERS